LTKNQVRMLLSCRITEVTDTLRIGNTLLFQGNNGYSNAPQYYITSTLAALLFLYNNRHKHC